MALRVGLAVAYPFLAHAANARDSGALAALALADIAVIVLLGPLLRRRVWAWGVLAIIAILLAWLAGSPYALLPLLAPPVVFVGYAAWLFARSLRRGRTPLITRMAMAVQDETPETLAPELHRYTRGLTLAWALLLAGLCAINLLLALFSVPGGLLARLGMTSPLPVTDVLGSLFANLLIYGVVGGFFVLEYVWRRHRFPQHDDHGFFDFLRRLATLGPAFWRDLLR